MLQELLDHPVNRVVAAAFAAAGVPLFLVGGSVRDALCGVPDFSDLDYATPTLPEDTVSIVSPLGPVWDVGAAFGTIGVQVSGTKVEVTTFRTETYEPGSRKPVVGFGTSIDADLLRRDLTINALALCLVGDGHYRSGELVDLFGGRADLESGTLRTPDQPERSMSEDPLRQLRVVRFAAKRKMSIGSELAAAITDQSGRLSVIAVERCTEELRKVAAAGPDVLADALSIAGKFDLSVHLVGDLPSGPDEQATLRRLPSDARLEESLAVLGLRFGPELGNVLRSRKLSSAEVGLTARIVRAAHALESAQDILAVRLLVRAEADDALDGAVNVLTAALRPPPAQVELLSSARVEAELLRSLPITGDDIVGAGLKGPAVGAALRKGTLAFLGDPTLSRSEVLRAALAA